MTLRTLNSPVGDQRGEFTYLYEINHSGGTIRLTSASSDLTTLGFEWTAVGGTLIHSGAPDVADRKAQSIDLELFGVSQSIISLIQNNQFRGRLIKIYLVHRDIETGDILTPDLVFQGKQNADYKISETRDYDAIAQGVSVKTRISADLSAINIRQSCRCNVHSHEEFLRRNGTVSPDDKFFERVITIMDTDIFWGSAAPEKARRGYSGGGGIVDDEEEIGG